MRKFILLSSFVFLSIISFAQIRGFPEKIEKIPSTVQDSAFIDTLQNDFKRLISEKVDSILLFYMFEINNNYAVIFWKKGEQTCSKAFYQYSPRRSKIESECLKSSILNGIDICSIHSIVKDSSVRLIDTTIMVSSNEPVYCQFYFGNKKRIYVGFRGAIFGSMNLQFHNAFVTESNRIMKREKEKYWK